MGIRNLADHQPPPGFWAAKHPVPVPTTRPRILLLADLYVTLIAVLLGRLLLGGLLVPGFLSDPGNVPPYLAAAALDAPHIVVGFGLPVVVAGLVLFRLRWPERLSLSWGDLGALWVLVALLETPVVDPTFTLALLLGAIIPAIVVGSAQSWFRADQQPARISGPWLRARRLIPRIAVWAALGWTVLYVIIVFPEMMELAGRWQDRLGSDPNR
ncbi:MAG: hypothetical protein ABIZ30_01810 [Candidatus Limnocylindrales bacterium]